MCECPMSRINKENGRRMKKKTIIASTEADQIDFKLRNMSMSYLDRVLYSHKVSIYMQTYLIITSRY